jgi:hypothetical protein
MRSSRACAFFLAALTLGLGWSRPARAQQPAQGFAAERLYQSAPGGGWIVMDALDMHGALGGVLALSAGYAHDPLRVATTTGSQHLTLISDDAFVNFGFAMTYDRWRFYLNFDAPVAIEGQSGTVGGYAFSAPSVDPASHPDTFSDVRLGTDVRFFGDARSPFRLGAGLQLYIPHDDESTADYVTDGTFRAMARLLAAGDVGAFAYAGQLGVHVRPRDDAPLPGPHGSEALFGVAGGRRFLLGSEGREAIVVGPEVYGESAFRSFLGTTATGLEALMTGRIEETADSGTQLRVKLGMGGGLNPHFGAPEWRAVFVIDVFDRSFAKLTDRDADGVEDSKDACPDVAGVKTSDPRTRGCPDSSSPP